MFKSKASKKPFPTTNTTGTVTANKKPATTSPVRALLELYLAPGIQSAFILALYDLANEGAAAAAVSNSGDSSRTSNDHASAFAWLGTERFCINDQSLFMHNLNRKLLGVAWLSWEQVKDLLHLLGFKRVDDEEQNRTIFSHPDFCRDQEMLLLNVKEVPPSRRIRSETIVKADALDY